MRTVFYAILHFVVDYICAWSMISLFCDGAYFNLFVYNFCAFALQMPLGVILDLSRSKTTCLPPAFAIGGILLTIAGAFLHPAILGLGNALFHIGGGVDVIYDDLMNHRRGRCLGLFVAPGALGLSLGTYLGKHFQSVLVMVPALALICLFVPFLLHCSKSYSGSVENASVSGSGFIVLIVCCVAVVILRSWVGLSISFPWKNVPLLGAFAVLCTAGGKWIGGLIASGIGTIKTALISLLISIFCYLFGDNAIFGLIGILMFNMSMPLTLYLLVSHMPGFAGFAFGLLTFSLFLGFLPPYLGFEVSISSSLMGALCSGISLILLLIAGKAVRIGKVSS